MLYVQIKEVIIVSAEIRVFLIRLFVETNSKGEVV